MIAQIYAHAQRLGLSQGMLLALAREAAHDAKLRCIEDMHTRDLEQLAALFTWITMDEAWLLTQRRGVESIRNQRLTAA
jgi:hypothetical protein